MHIYIYICIYAGMHVVHHEEFKAGSYTKPVNNFDIVSDIWKGRIKDGLREMFLRSSEESITICKKPAPKVICNAQFKVDAFRLVPLTTSVSVMADKNGKSMVAKELTDLGPLFEHKGGHVRGVIKSSVQFAGPNRTEFLVGYWVARTTHDIDEANAVIDKKTVSFNVTRSTRVDLVIPTIVNTKPLAVGDEIVCLKRKAHVALPAMPDKMGKVKGKGNKRGKK